jgi:hypothetical protein
MSAEVMATSLAGGCVYVGGKRDEVSCTLNMDMGDVLTFRFTRAWTRRGMIERASIMRPTWCACSMASSARRFMQGSSSMAKTPGSVCWRLTAALCAMFSLRPNRLLFAWLLQRPAAVGGGEKDLVPVPVVAAVRANLFGRVVVAEGLAVWAVEWCLCGSLKVVAEVPDAAATLLCPCEWTRWRRCSVMCVQFVASLKLIA